MKEQVGCDEVDTLNIAYFLVVDAIAVKNLSEHLAKGRVSAEGGCISVSSIYVFADLRLIFGVNF